MNYRGGRPPVGWANTFRLEEEIGDRMIYLVSIADKFEIKILEVGIEKIKLNTKEYPAPQVRGSYIEDDLYPGVLNYSTS